MAQQPLSGFRKLNAQVSYFEPETSKQQQSGQPCLVIMCAWAFAAPRHIEKYTKLYQSLLPSASILLIRPVIGDMAWTSDATQLRTLEAAVLTIWKFQNEHLTSQSKQPTKIVLQAFSNAGSHAAVQLAEAYRKYALGNVDGTEQQLPLSALILDSCPGRPSAALSILATIHGMPKYIILRSVAYVLLWLLMGVAFMLHELGISENSVSKARKGLIGSDFLRSRGEPVPRLYLYSKGDVMVPYRDVQDHAEEARHAMEQLAVAAADVREVEFAGGGHIGHVVVDKKGYRKAVSQLLEDVGVAVEDLLHQR